MEEEGEEDDIEDEGSPIEKITEFRFVPSSPDTCKLIVVVISGYACDNKMIAAKSALDFISKPSLSS